MNHPRKKTKTVKIGNVAIGGKNPIAVQTMTNTKTEDIEATVSQINSLIETGADLVRVSIPNRKSSEALKTIIKRVEIPIIADIHFQWRLAIDSIFAGASKIRINPGTIGSKKGVDEIIKIALKHDIPIRIGLNAASLPKRFKNLNHIKALSEAANYWVKYFEDRDFYNIVISAKSSSPLETVEAYREISKNLNYPLHIGVTEAGTLFSGTVKSSAALAILLNEGIGDTLRISLSAAPEYEVKAGIELLKALELRDGPRVISCPTCSRTQINVEKIAKIIEDKLSSCKIPVKVAVMGCEVNGPGEAKNADIGIAGAKKGIMLFKKGTIIGTYDKETAISLLLKEIENIYR